MASPSFSLLQGDPTTWGVPPVGKTYVGINDSGQLILKQNDGSIVPIISSAPSVAKPTNSSGATLITLGAQIHTAILTITGTSRSVPIVLDIDGAAAGAQLTLQVNWPGLAGFDLDIRNADSGGTQLDTFQTDGSILNGLWRFVYDGTAWNKIEASIPAF